MVDTIRGASGGIVDDPTRMFRLDGRTAIVTGASSGLGVVMSEALAGAGANVVLAARRTERIEELARSITAAGGKALAVPCDVSREDDVDRMIAATQERFGSLDVLVNNAGVANPQPAEQESLDDFKRVLDVNFGGVFLCAQRCARVMLAEGRASSSTSRRCSAWSAPARSRRRPTPPPRAASST